MGLDGTDPLESLRARWAEGEPAADGLRQSGDGTLLRRDTRLVARLGLHPRVAVHRTDAGRTQWVPGSAAEVSHMLPCGL